MNRTALFIVQPADSHIIAVLNLANTLKEKGINIAFLNHPKFSVSIVKKGFSFYSIDCLPFGYGYEDYFTATDSYLDKLINRLSNKLYTIRESELKKIVKIINPSYIFIDITMSTDFIVLYKFIKKNEIVVKFLQLMMSTRTHKFIPVYNSKISFSNSKVILGADFYYRNIRDRIKIFYNKIKWLGMDAYSD